MQTSVALYKVRVTVASGSTYPDSKFQVSYRGAGIDAAEDAARGWDHGVFVPLKLAFPAAALPVVELSVLSSLDPEARALCVQCKGGFDMNWFGPLVSGPVLCMLTSLGHIVALCGPQ